MGEMKYDGDAVAVAMTFTFICGLLLASLFHGNSVNTAQRAMKEPATAWELYIEAKDYADNQYREAYGLGREEK